MSRPNLAGHRQSALVVGRQGRPEAPLELLDVGRAGGTACVAHVDLVHRVVVGPRLDLFQDPRDEAVQRVLGNADAFGDLLGAQPAGYVA